MGKKYQRILNNRIAIAANEINKPGMKRRVLLLYKRQFLLRLLVLIGLSAVSFLCFSKTIIYVANTDSQNIAVFQLNETTGKPTLLQNQQVEGAVMPMRLLHITANSSNGYSPKNSLLYAAIRSEPYRLVILTINPVDGTLSTKSSLPLTDNMANIAFDRDGRYLFAASYSGNRVSAYRLDSEGIPGLGAQVVDTGAHPHQITVDEQNQFVYVSLLGEDRLDYYRFHSKNKTGVILGSLKKSAITLSVDSGPRHFIFSKKHNVIYLLNELNASVQVLARNLKTGALLLMETYLLLTSNIKPWAADIHITPEGKFLYATERSTHRIFGFAINQKNGRLKAIGSWETEMQPRAFGISPQGGYLVVVGQKSNHMSIYRIAPDNGRLELADRIATGRNPSWVEIIGLPEVE